jgi:hypothetical protein
MEVFRQYADGNSCERQATLNGTICFSEETDFLDEKIAGTIGKRYRKEVRATIDLCSQILGHETAGEFHAVGTTLRAFAHPTRMASEETGT